METFETLSKTANDWQITSYGDVGGFAGYGGKLSHFEFHSPSLKGNLTTILIDVGLGASVKIEFSFLGAIGAFLDKTSKATAAANARSGFKAVNCFKSFSRMDIIGATAGAVDSSVASISGMKAGGMWVNKGNALLFEIPAEVGGMIGLGAGFSLTGGIFMGIGAPIHQAYSRQAWEIETRTRKRASDPLLKPPGGF